MAKQQKERRKRPRVNTPHFVNVVDAATGQPLGRLVNVTADGIMLVTEFPIMPFRDFELRLLLPRMVGDRLEMEVYARSIWCKPDENPAFHRVGFELKSVDAQDAYLLETVMHTFHLGA